MGQALVFPIVNAAYSIGSMHEATMPIGTAIQNLIQRCFAYLVTVCKNELIESAF